MKMFKWSLLVVALVAVLGFASITPCTASDVQPDNAVMADDNTAYDSEQYAEETYTDEGGTYEESEYQEEGGEYMDEPEGEPVQDEEY